MAYRKAASLRPYSSSFLINDLPVDTNTGIEAFLFADDCAIWKDGNNLNHVTNSLQAQFVLVFDWCAAWGLELNPTKTVEVIFKRKTFEEKPKFKICKSEKVNAKKSNFSVSLLIASSLGQRTSLI